MSSYNPIPQQPRPGGQPSLPAQYGYGQQPPMPAQGPKQTGSKKLPLIAGITVGVIGLFSIIGAATGSHDGTATADSAPVTATSAPGAEATETREPSSEPSRTTVLPQTKSVDHSTPAPKPAAKPKPKPAPKAAPKPTMTRSQEEAIGAARDYLEFQAFSRYGLIHQLSSEYGSGFSKKDATFAVDHLDVNWNKQAAKAAEDYLEFQHFSRAGLIHQLESKFGSGFTHSQAVYGVNKAGL